MAGPGDVRLKADLYKTQLEQQKILDDIADDMEDATSNIGLATLVGQVIGLGLGIYTGDIDKTLKFADWSSKIAKYGYGKNALNKIKDREIPDFKFLNREFQEDVKGIYDDVDDYVEANILSDIGTSMASKVFRSKLDPTMVGSIEGDYTMGEKMAMLSGSENIEGTGFFQGIAGFINAKPGTPAYQVGKSLTNQNILSQYLLSDNVDAAIGQYLSKYLFPTPTYTRDYQDYVQVGPGGGK